MNNYLKELFLYILIGIFVVLIDFLSYQFLIRFIEIDVSNSKRLSYIIGSLFSFVLNKIITFKSSDKNLKEPVLFSIVYFFGFVSNSLTHDFLINYLDGNGPFYISTIFSVLINYFGQKFIVFKK
tara:strand:+ start:324 stop:698 length:375 start_codon:yes stop_codon:yes gene_type:complete